MDGIIVIDKPQGMTSHDVVGVVRRLTGVRKVGHTGTLDPMATGVLPVCVGKATRIIEFIDMDNAPDAKGYDCEMRLGVRSDTLDIWGNVIDDCLARPGDGNGGAVSVSVFAESGPGEFRRSVPGESEIANVLMASVGDIEQVPPAYSAIKYKGRKLYELARRGDEIPQDAVKPRRVHVESIEVGGIEFDEASETDSRSGFATVRFSVVCSKGTYVRSIVRDAGDALGCGAVMSALRRTKSGVFTLADAYPLSVSSGGKHEFSHGVDAGGALLPIDSAIPYLSPVDAEKTDARKFVNGIQIAAGPVRVNTDSTEPVSAMDGKPGSVKIIGSMSVADERMFVRVYGGGSFLGVGKIEGGMIKPYKVIMA